MSQRSMSIFTMFYNALWIAVQSTQMYFTEGTWGLSDISEPLQWSSCNIEHKVKTCYVWSTYGYVQEDSYFNDIIISILSIISIILQYQLFQWYYNIIQYHIYWKQKKKINIYQSMCVQCSTLNLNCSAGYSYKQGRGWVSARRSHHDRNWQDNEHGTRSLLPGQTWALLCDRNVAIESLCLKQSHRAHQSENSSLSGEYKGTNAQQEQNAQRNKEQYVRLLRYMKLCWGTDYIFTNKYAKSPLPV